MMLINLHGFYFNYFEITKTGILFGTFLDSSGPSSCYYTLSLRLLEYLKRIFELKSRAKIAGRIEITIIYIDLRVLFLSFIDLKTRHLRKNDGVFSRINRFYMALFHVLISLDFWLFLFVAVRKFH